MFSLISIQLSQPLLFQCYEFFLHEPFKFSDFHWVVFQIVHFPPILVNSFYQIVVPFVPWLADRDAQNCSLTKLEIYCQNVVNSFQIFEIYSQHYLQSMISTYSHYYCWTLCLKFFIHFVRLCSCSGSCLQMDRLCSWLNLLSVTRLFLSYCFGF